VETQQLVRGEKGRFAKGSGGRPRGSKNNASKEIKQFAARVLLADDPEAYLRNVRMRIMQGLAPHMERFFAEHLWGRARERIEHSVSGDLVQLLGERLKAARAKAQYGHSHELTESGGGFYVNGHQWPKPAIVAGDTDGRELPEGRL
jgi:hypothetical protein